MHDLPPSAFLRRSPSDPRHGYGPVWVALALAVSAACGFLLGQDRQEPQTALPPVAVHVAVTPPSPAPPSQPATAPTLRVPQDKNVPLSSRRVDKPRTTAQAKAHEKTRLHAGHPRLCAKLKAVKARVCRALFSR
mgnify:CR=1 FL=1